MKNRYCRRTKLTEEEFMFIVLFFCRGWPAQVAKDEFTARGMKVSRQTIERKYLELGDWHYRKFSRPEFLRLNKECNPGLELPDEEWEQTWIDELWENMRGTLDYTSYRRDGVNYPGHDTLIATLRARWQLFNGFQKEKFRSHLGFATFFDTSRRFSTLEKTISGFIRELEKDPL